MSLDESIQLTLLTRLEQYYKIEYETDCSNDIKNLAAYAKLLELEEEIAEFLITNKVYGTLSPEHVKWKNYDTGLITNVITYFNLNCQTASHLVALEYPGICEDLLTKEEPIQLLAKDLHSIIFDYNIQATGPRLRGLLLQKNLQVEDLLALVRLLQKECQPSKKYFTLNKDQDFPTLINALFNHDLVTNALKGTQMAFLKLTDLHDPAKIISNLDLLQKLLSATLKTKTNTKASTIS